jgi:hypothetical protein
VKEEFVSAVSADVPKIKIGLVASCMWVSGWVYSFQLIQAAGPSTGKIIYHQGIQQNDISK